MRCQPDRLLQRSTADVAAMDAHCAGKITVGPTQRCHLGLDPLRHPILSGDHPRPSPVGHFYIALPSIDTLLEYGCVQARLRAPLNGTKCC